MKCHCKFHILNSATTKQGTVEFTNYEILINDNSYALFNSMARKLKRKDRILKIYFKHFLGISFEFSSTLECDSVFQILQARTNITSLEDVPCFRFDGDFSEEWSLDWLDDMARLLKGNDSWRLSNLNHNFKFCPTYPSSFAVPTSISDNTLRHVGKFRSKGRIPVLSYIHSNMCSITRSAQPLVGLKQNSSIQDEKLVEAIFLASGADLSLTTHIIMDARPLANAIGQTALGAGTESSDNYFGSKIMYLGIENIHVVRDSFNRMYDACLSFDSLGGKKLAIEKSGWSKHLKTILSGAGAIVNAICNDTNVLVHCSDGWDRTAQLSALAQICLDPYYRTIDGLMVLIEKEWVMFGHKFNHRLGLLCKSSVQDDKLSLQQASRQVFGAIGAAQKFWDQAFNTNLVPVDAKSVQSESWSPNNEFPKESSPVFVQFLDSLYQLWTQYPTCFEFDERVLGILLRCAYSCEFGNFLFNSSKESLDFTIRGKGVRNAAPSLWAYISNNKDLFVNTLYSRNDKVILPSDENIRVWNYAYFNACGAFNDLGGNLEADKDPIESTTIGVQSLIIDDKADISMESMRDAEQTQLEAESESQAIPESQIESSNSIKSYVDTNVSSSSDVKSQCESDPQIFSDPLQANPWVD